MANIDIETQLTSRLKETVRTRNNEHWFVVRPDVYAIPHADGYVLYSPLQGLVSLITQKGLSSLLLNDTQPISKCLADCVFADDSATLQLFDTLPKQGPNIRQIRAAEYKPASLMLSPTSACQLACIYCYIKGGERPRNMAWPIAEQAIRYTFKNAVERGIFDYSITFHGQGEPSLNWDLVKKAVSLTERLCAQSGVRPLFFIVTNGILNEEQISFLAGHHFDVCLSMDGGKEIMEKQRPMRNGESSFERIMQTIKQFELKGIPYAIRSTITPENVEKMKEFVAFLKNNTLCKHVSLEPLFRVGRAMTNRMNEEEVIEKIVNHIIEAQQFGEEIGMTVNYSACRIEGTRQNFCGAYGAELTFAVSTEGLVSSCYEVLDEEDPRAEMFIYGKYDEATRDFQFDDERLQRLLNLGVNKIESCADCYIRWNCGGGCIAKAEFERLEGLKNDTPLLRCKADNKLITHALFKSVLNQSKVLQVRG